MRYSYEQIDEIAKLRNCENATPKYKTSAGGKHSMHMIVYIIAHHNIYLKGPHVEKTMTVSRTISCWTPYQIKQLNESF